MYKYKCGILPANFNDCFTLSSSVHSHNTRGASKGDFHITFDRTSYSKNSLMSNGIIFWNNLQTSIKQSLMLKSFSRKIKMSFLKCTCMYKTKSDNCQVIVIILLSSNQCNWLVSSVCLSVLV